MPTTTTAPALPHWESAPADLGAAAAEIKRAIRARIAASGRTVEEVFADLEDRIRVEVEAIEAEVARGEEPWPVVDYADVEGGTVSEELRAKIARRGCALVRGTFPREVAEQWDRDIVDYVESNEFFDNYRGAGDDFFATVDSKPEIYPLYWSRAQVEARQSERMATVQSFMSSFWNAESGGTQWFDPTRSVTYPDRMRRRPPGTTSAGLGAHVDAGTADLWMSEGYQKAFASLYSGDLDAFDPWSAAHRTEATQYEGTTMTSVFRTFQGWTALSDAANTEGNLHTVPIPSAIAYLLLRPLLSDIADDDLCTVRPGRTFPVTEQWHSLLLRALVPVPDVEPGDTVWWHGDMIHSVGAVEDQKGWGNVMYIPAAPFCERNLTYARGAYDAFLEGRSPADFPEEDYEAAWDNRMRDGDLTDLGRRGFGV